MSKNVRITSNVQALIDSGKLEVTGEDIQKVFNIQKLINDAKKYMKADENEYIWDKKRGALLLGNERQEEKFYVFFGFNGDPRLIRKYCTIRGKSYDDIMSSFSVLGKGGVGFSILTPAQFEISLKILANTNDRLTEIPYEEVLFMFRNPEKIVEEEIIDEPEVDAFDDNCVDTCIPGRHQCGK